MGSRDARLRRVRFLAASLLFLLLGFALSVTRFGPDNVAVNSPYLVMEAFGLMSLIALSPRASSPRTRCCATTTVR